jgi:hypothetical protein
VTASLVHSLRWFRRGLGRFTDATGWTFRTAERHAENLLVETPWHKRVALLVSLFGLVAVFASLAVAFPESWWVDERFASRTGRYLSDDLVLVGLDEDYAERFGDAAPVRQEHLSQLLDALARYGPSTIAVDVLVKGRTADTAGFASFVAAAERASRSGVRIVLPSRIGGYGSDRRTGRDLRLLTSPPHPLDTLVYSGFVDYEVVVPQSQHTLLDLLRPVPAIREVPLLSSLEEHVRDDAGNGAEPPSLVGSFPFVAVAAHRRLIGRGTDPPRITQSQALRAIRDLRLPAAARNQVALGMIVRPVVIDYASPATPGGSGIRYYSSVDFLELDRRKEFAPGSLGGKLVVVAAVFPSRDGSDVARTPFGLVRGGVVHLHAIDTLLQGRYPTRLGALATVLLCVTLFGVVLKVARRSALVALIGTAGVAFAYIAVGFALFEHGIWLPLAWPIWASLLAGGVGATMPRPPLNPRQGPPTATAAPSIARSIPPRTVTGEARLE